MKQKLFITLIYLCSSILLASQAFADGPLHIEAIKIKGKGSWTEVQVAIQNSGKTSDEFECCTVYLENTEGFAISSLTQYQIQSQIHNKAKTGAILGGLAAAGLGLGGIISGNNDLGYAAVGVGAASIGAGAIGEAAAEKTERDLVIDDIMRIQEFPQGLKVTGVVYFPPKKKWPGSRNAQAIHLTYKYRGKTYQTHSDINKN